MNISIGQNWVNKKTIWVYSSFPLKRGWNNNSVSSSRNVSSKSHKNTYNLWEPRTLQTNYLVRSVLIHTEWRNCTPIYSLCYKFLCIPFLRDNRTRKICFLLLIFTCSRENLASICKQQCHRIVMLQKSRANFYRKFGKIVQESYKDKRLSEQSYRIYLTKKLILRFMIRQNSMIATHSLNSIRWFFKNSF